MIVIIEGIDGVGKTTIAEEIAVRKNFKYIKESYTKSYEEKECRMIDMLTRLTQQKDYIYDRTTLIDDFVYSFLNSNEQSLDKYFDIISAILSKCKIVHLQIDEKIRKKRFEQRGDQYIKNKDIKKIAKNYDDFYCKLNTQINFVQLTGNLNKDVKKVLEVIEND